MKLVATGFISSPISNERKEEFKQTLVRSLLLGPLDAFSNVALKPKVGFAVNMRS